MLESELNQKTVDLEQLSQRLRQTAEELEEAMLGNGGRAPSTYQFEISQLREDNARLLGMLRKTKEFKDFNGFVADSGGKVRTLGKERSGS